MNLRFSISSRNQNSVKEAKPEAIVHIVKRSSEQHRVKGEIAITPVEGDYKRPESDAPPSQQLLRPALDVVILAALVALTTAAPQYNYSGSDEDSSESKEVVPILRDDRVLGNDGSYNFDVETGNGIVLSRSGSPDGPDDSVVISGQYSYTAPDGTPVVVKFVADENGYQPQSDLLPVAPELPHPVPQFVLDQIAFAAAEDAARSQESDEVPHHTYGIAE
ncbi:larval cuticle protein LCP-17-like [Homarus americanus]|uniref:larval cuticle protein LCP-17-like n=1 Tax=Homarus americanus TaxID=6706 RepID=UPI001C460C0A|nr:larval cuticle protein LCP-17-like [Homarus americanus]